MVLRGIVARSEIDGAVKFAALNFVGDSRSGSESVAEKCADTVLLENGYGERRKFFRVEARIVGDEDTGFGGFRFDVFGDGGDGETDGCKREIVGDEAPPAGGAKFYWGSGDARRSAHSRGSVDRTRWREKRGNRARIERDG